MAVKLMIYLFIFCLSGCAAVQEFSQKINSGKNVKGGWQDDGGYIGAYPGGCVSKSDCEDDEFCIYPEEEIQCPENPEDPRHWKCRCMLGCMFENHYLRFQQYRQIADKPQTCKCDSPKGNKYGCVPKYFDDLTNELAAGRH